MGLCWPGTRLKEQVMKCKSVLCQLIRVEWCTAKRDGLEEETVWKKGGWEVHEREETGRPAEKSEGIRKEKNK